jgi:hypothetical protein
VLTYTGTTRAVRIDLEVALQSLVRPGIPAQIVLPDGTPIEGRVAAVGAVARTAGDEPNAPVTIDVTVSVSNQAALGRLDQAPVAVTLAAATRPKVLAVPVAALVVLAEGGYGVQVYDAGATRYVAVVLGMFATGLVEVSGAGLAEGTRIVVPS